MFDFQERAIQALNTKNNEAQQNPRILAIFNKYCEFVQEARKQKKETTIFFIPLVTWWHHRSISPEPNSEIGVELHQTGPFNRNKEVELNLTAKDSEKPGKSYTEFYKISAKGQVWFSTEGKPYKPLEGQALEERLPLLEEVATKLGSGPSK
ncbi:hypothetical protein HY502_00885 [Candidatus Woesebacteria bacterium]|nr:hypothetical protein [Candidatus Woesebacteria bacterium]